MSIGVEAVGGVLLAVPEDLARDRLTAVEDGVLLAWLAAAKPGGPRIAATLGKIGWVLSEAAGQDETLALPDVGAAILGAAMPSAPAGLPERLAAENPDPVIEAWWARTEAAGFFAFAQIATDGTLSLASFTVALPSRRLLLFGPPPLVGVDRAVMTGTLNSAVFDPVAGAVAAKIAPFRDQIVTA